jgi:predicted HTH domain antitoxin
MPATSSSPRSSISKKPRGIEVVEVRFTVPVGEPPEEYRAEAERKAQEAFVLALLRRGHISAGRTAEVLGINRWELGDLMSSHGISPLDETMTREQLEQEVANAARVLSGQNLDPGL